MGDGFLMSERIIHANGILKKVKEYEEKILMIDGKSTESVLMIDEIHRMTEE